MAETSKEKSADQKKKNSFVDDDMGDDFLKSWKSMSVMKDNGMDFSFDTGSKNKKKVFDFDKLDMDFNLDGDFNKISSFKMDMSDFDFSSSPKKDSKTKELDISDLDLSSPPKTSAKTKEKSEEEPSRRSHQGKQDQFKFSFDFNELDSFDLDSTLSRKEKSSKNLHGRKEAVPVTAGSKGCKVDLAKGISTLDGVSETVTTSKVDIVSVDPGNCNSMNDCASESETSGNFELPPGPRCQEKIMSQSIEESSQESQLPEKAVSVEPYAETTTHDSPAEHVGGLDSIGDAGVDKKNGGCPQIKNVNSISSGKNAVMDKMLIEDDSNHEDLPSKNSSPLDIGSLGGGYRSMSGSDPVIENDEPPKGDLDNGETLATLVSRKTPHDIKSTKVSTQASESTVDKVMLRKESGAGEHCLKTSKRLEDTGPQLYQPPLIGPKSLLSGNNKIGSTYLHRLKTSKRLEDTGPQLYQPPLIGPKSLLSGNNKIGSTYLHPVIEKGVSVTTNDAQHGSKSLTTPVLVDKETKVRPAIPARVESSSEGVPNRTKVGKPQLCDKEVTEGEPVVTSERKNLKDLRVQDNPPSSTENTRKLSSQSLKPKIMLPSVEPLRNSRITTADGNKGCPDKPVQKKINMSTWKTSKNIGGNKHSMSAAPQKEVKSQRSSEQNKEVQGKMAMETRQIVDGSEKMPRNLPLKRKTSEGLNPGLASLKPLKRLSVSPRETRNFAEPSKGTDEQIHTHENHLEIKTKSPSSRLGSPSTVNLMELELPSAMETDENVEKAEAYTKELEHICNMLKKKHEEAKEILVRAVVNNNNLLMLNHPIYEAKIHKVQKFAARLASKELHAC